MEDMVVPLSEQFISESLQQDGYDTAYIGKWHLGEKEGYRPQQRGFDRFLGFLSGASLYLPYSDPRLVFANVPGEPTDDFLRFNLGYFVEDNDRRRFAPNSYITDYLADQASTAIRSQSEQPAPAAHGQSSSKPFFLTVGFNAPHNPYQALKEDYDHPEMQAIGDHRQRVYAAMIRALDRGVGTILKAVKDTGKIDNTIIIFTSDNGGATYTGSSSSIIHCLL
jgi:arylsulfatase A-like enzyme